MAATILGSGTSSGQAWQVDYDGVSTLGLTCTGPGTLVISVTITATQQTFSLDSTQFLNQGRVVLAGPGSVLGFPSPIPPSAVPVPVKGHPPAFTFTSSSSPTLHKIAGGAQRHDGGLVGHLVRAIQQTQDARNEPGVPSGTTAALDVALSGLYGALIARIFEG
jgi:hypothetical protein